jgi:hypothetical protein
MPSVSKNEAIDRLATAIERSELDDLIEVYNELRPESPRSLGGSHEGREELLSDIKDYIRQGLEVEEVVDLWNVVFPQDRNVWYDEETDLVRFNEEPEHVESTE